MKTLLIHENTFKRLGDRLQEFDQQIRVLTMDLNGAFHMPLEGGAVVDTPAPDIAFGNGDVWFNPRARKFIAAILETPHLEWFQSSAAGIEMPALVSIGKKADAYTTAHDQAEAIAEWALWAVLDVFREGPLHRERRAERVWKRIASREICGSRWLVVGFGSIGSAVGKRVRALGGHVTGVRRSGGESPYTDNILTAVEPDALSSADVVLFCMPHTPMTAGMADAAFFARMKSDAVFVNVGRGALVNEPDLIAALDAGRPGFACLDVTAVEPLPEDSALWEHSKVMLTPHDSSQTPGTIARTDEVFLGNLRRFLDGTPLRHLEDKAHFV